MADPIGSPLVGDTLTPATTAAIGEPATAPAGGATPPVFAEPPTISGPAVAQPVVVEPVVTPALGRAAVPEAATAGVLVVGDFQTYWTPAAEGSASALAVRASAAGAVSNASADPTSAAAGLQGKELFGAHLGWLDYLLHLGEYLMLKPSEAPGAPFGAPQPTPVGAPPTGGSADSSSGTGGGLSLAILALFSFFVLGGKHLWSSGDFLRPNSALRLAIERPG